MLETWQAGKVPLSVAAHDEVARQYNIPTINLAKETADRIAAGTLTWKEFGGTHPKKPGNALCADMIDRLMKLSWGDPLAPNAVATAHRLPKPLDANSYFRGRMIDPSAATVVRDVTVTKPDWSAVGGNCRDRFDEEKLLCAEKPGAEMSLDFDGTAIGAFVLAGPDAGIVETSVDNAPFKPTNLFHRFSKKLHYPRVVVFDADLAPGPHTLRLRIANEKYPASAGHAMRALHFVAN